jgi:hypothetical protein
MSGIEIPASVQRDRDAIEQGAIAATKQLADLKAAYDASPEVKLERDRERLSELQNNPFHLNAKLAGNSAAHSEESALRSRIETALARMGGASTRGPDRLDQAFAPREAGPLMDVSTDGELSLADMREMIADYRSIGLSDECIREAVHGSEYPAPIIEEAKQRLQQRMSDPEWMARLYAKDGPTRKEFTLLNIVIKARAKAA